ncbi:MAG: GlcG/HbpS family heme-binding protein, partial [Gemmatimonadales bacterium]
MSAGQTAASILGQEMKDMSWTKGIGAALVLSLVAGTTQAQTLNKKGLSLEGARQVIAGAVAYARTKAGTAVIAVVDEGGNLMALERLDNTFAAGANISIGKARTAVLFKKPTKVFEDIIKNGRTSMVALNDFTPLQGGVPILVDGQVVGGVGVSGASSAQEDEEVAMAGAAALGTTTTSLGASLPQSVNYFTRDEVAASFAKGAVLLDGNGRSYMVHTSRRATPGQAEIHTRDTDIIYVIDGSATFVTGGTALDPKTVAPDEIRGSAVQG